MEFTHLPPGVAGAPQTRPTGAKTRRSVPSPPPSSLDAILDRSVDWQSTAQVQLAWLTTGLGWLATIFSGVAAYAATVADSSSFFGWLLTFGGHPWFPIGVGSLACAALLVVAAFSGGLRRFDQTRLQAFQWAAGTAVVASAGAVAAAVAAAVFVVVAIVLTGALLVALVMAAFDS